MNGSFSTGLAKWPKLLKSRHLSLKRGVAIKLFTAVIKDSPVDTGRLRANWRTNLKSPDRTTSESKVSEAVVIGEMASKAVTVSEKDSLFMTNSLPYVRRIEYDGWSHTKAPQGMVNRNALRFSELLKKQLNSLKIGGGL